MNSRRPGPIRTPGPPGTPPRGRARTRVRALAAVAVGTLGISALTGCSVFSSAGTEGARSGKDGRLAVVASFYPMQFLAEEIGGDRVQVSSLTEPGQEPHDLEISAQQTAQLEKADIALHLKGFQPSVDEAIQQSTIGTKIDAAALTSLETHGTEVDGAGEGHGHEPGEEGHASAQDPHFWLDPVRYAQVAKGIGKAFAKADPDHATGYRKNTDALVKRLNALDARYAEGLRDAPRKVFITTHASFGYLAARYGLTEEAISGMDPESEPSPGRVRDLQRMAKANGVTTVFYETLVSDKTAKTLASDAHLKTAVLDPIEGITDASKGDDYIEVMDANRRALELALGLWERPAGEGARAPESETEAEAEAEAGAEAGAEAQ